MFGSSHCRPLNIINLRRRVLVIHLLYNSSINIGVIANKSFNCFLNITHRSYRRFWIFNWSTDFTLIYLNFPSSFPDICAGDMKEPPLFEAEQHHHFHHCQRKGSKACYRYNAQTEYFVSLIPQPQSTGSFQF